MKEYTFALDPAEQGGVQIAHSMHAVTTGCFAVRWPVVLPDWRASTFGNLCFVWWSL